MKLQIFAAAAMGALLALPANAQEQEQCVLDGVTYESRSNVNDELVCVDGSLIPHKVEPDKGLTDVPAGAYGGGSYGGLGGILKDICSPTVPCLLM